MCARTEEMGKLAHHCDTVAVLVVLCPLAGLGAGLACNSLQVALATAAILLIVLVRTSRGQALWRCLSERQTNPTLTELIYVRAPQDASSRRARPSGG